jgi:predicted DNA-binding transcriptional regulator AlpA
MRTREQLNKAPRKRATPELNASPVTSSTDDSFITSRQVAERLHVKVSTVHEWSRRRNTNPIPHYPVSRKVVYYRWSEVAAWIQALRVAA